MRFNVLFIDHGNNKATMSIADKNSINEIPEVPINTDKTSETAIDANGDPNPSNIRNKCLR